MTKFKHNIFFLSALLFVLALSDVIICGIHYRNYQDKIEILAYMAQEEPGNGLDKAISVLKDSQPDYSQGFWLLEKYGYLKYEGNRYWRFLQKQYIWTTGISLTVYFFTGLLYFILEKRKQKQKSETLGKIEKALSAFIKGGRKDGNVLEGTLESLENEETERKETEREEIEREAAGIAMRLSELSEYISFVEEQAHEEREETKILVTNISHQLKTPVAALETCLFVLEQEGLTKEEEREFLSRAQTELEGLKSLLESLLQISKMETGMIEIRKERVPVFDTILEAVNRIYPKAREKQIEIVLEEEEKGNLGPEESGDIGQIFIWQDKKWLCEAFLNLLDNAVKYSPRESTVTICVGKSVSFLRITVQDEGIGIPKPEYHAIFKRFYRGGQKAVQSQSGSGVGLYLAREIISMHQGTITVCSNREKGKGEGSTFTVQLPL